MGAWKGNSSAQGHSGFPPCLLPALPTRCPRQELPGQCPCQAGLQGPHISLSTPCLPHPCSRTCFKFGFHLSSLAFSRAQQQQGVDVLQLFAMGILSIPGPSSSLLAPARRKCQGHSGCLAGSGPSLQLPKSVSPSIPLPCSSRTCRTSLFPPLLSLPGQQRMLPPVPAL